MRTCLYGKEAVLGATYLAMGSLEALDFLCQSVTGFEKAVYPVCLSFRGFPLSESCAVNFLLRISDPAAFPSFLSSTASNAQSIVQGRHIKTAASRSMRAFHTYRLDKVDKNQPQRRSTSSS